MFSYVVRQAFSFVIVCSVSGTLLATARHPVYRGVVLLLDDWEDGLPECGSVIVYQ